MRIAIVTSKATSLINVAKDIAYVIQRKHYTPRIFTRLMDYYDLDELSDALIIVFPSSPLWCMPYYLLYRDYKIHVGKPCLFYTMIEGKPVKRLWKYWMVRDVEVVTCSKYVAEKLQEVGMTIVDIIPHGLVKEQVIEAMKFIPTVRECLKELHGDKVIFGVVAHSHPRKGLQFLAEAVRILSQKRDDFVVHVITDDKGREKLQGIKNIDVDTVFGQRPREEILAFMGSCHYVIIPSLCEGFCLPLIEANAMGTPVIHCAYPPLTEISDPKINFTFLYDKLMVRDIGDGIEYEFHVYHPKKLAQMMDYCIELVKREDEEYFKRRKWARIVMERFNAEVHYSKLLEYLIG